MRLFAVVFLAVLLPGLAWDFLRPAQYRATAGLLTVVAPPSSPAGVAVADVQHVAIQRQVLLGRELLEETVRLAREETDLAVPSPDELGSILDVGMLPDTNLVELSAVGTEPELLSVVVNAWIEGYLILRQRVLEEQVGDRRRALETEIATLTADIESRRIALDTFRTEHDIVTLERDGNEALARLSALTTGLNRARDEAVEAEARSASIRGAIARGEPVVPASEQGNLERLETRAMELRAKLIGLKKRFTPLYLQNEPDLLVIPAQLEDLEAQIAAKLAAGREVMVVKLAQEVEQARRRVDVLEGELAEQKSVANRFTTAFARYEAMQEGLAELQEMDRDLQSQLVELEVKGLEKYPPVDVIEAAHPPVKPFEPRYWRDAGWVLVAALAAGLCAILLLEFLTRRPPEDAPPAAVTGVRVFTGAPGPDPGLSDRREYPPALQQTPVPSMSGGQPLGRLPGVASDGRERELIAAEVGALWALADPMSRELMALLLSGVTLDECADLRSEHFDLDVGIVHPPGEPARPVRLTGLVRELFAACRPLPVWAAGGRHLTPDELSMRIGLLAHDAGLAQPAEVTAAALRHTYIAYLVRQGARLTELERVIGPTPPSQLARYAGLAPTGAAKSLSDVDLGYPILRAEPAT